MNLDEKLQAVHDEIGGDDVRAPEFRTIRARHARRRRTRVAAGGTVLAAVAAVGVVVALPGSPRHAQVQPLTSVTTAPPTTTPSAPSGRAAGLPAAGHGYVVVPSGTALRWHDLVTGTDGTFPVAAGGAINHPSVSADGSRLVWATQGDGGPSIRTFDLDSGRQTTVRTSSAALQTPAISPDGLQIAWYDEARGGVVTAAFGSEASQVAVRDVQQLTFDASEALVYAPTTETTCALQRRTAAGATSCALTASAVAAKLGSGWSVAEVHGSGATDSVAVGLLGPDEAIEVAVVHADGTFEPIAATKVARGTQIDGATLIDGGTRLAYAEQHVMSEQATQQPVVKVVSLKGGAAQTVATGGELGFGIASGR